MTNNNQRDKLVKSMNFRMILSCDYHEIFNSIIRLNMIKVMNQFSLIQQSTKVLLHNISMFRIIALAIGLRVVRQKYHFIAVSIQSRSVVPARIFRAYHTLFYKLPFVISRYSYMNIVSLGQELSK
jgi:hypothetical protein